MSIDLNPDTIKDAVVRQVADQIIDDEELFSRVRKEIDRRLDNIFAERVDAEVAGAIHKITEEGFDRSFQERDQFGSPVGDPTTIRERLAKITKDYWAVRVDRSGKETNSSYSSMSRAEYVLINALGDDFAKEFKQQAVNVAANIKDSLRENLRNWMDTALGDVFHVRTATDKKEGRRK